MNWNIATRQEPWRQLLEMDADVALLMESNLGHEKYRWANAAVNWRRYDRLSPCDPRHGKRGRAGRRLERVAQNALVTGQSVWLSRWDGTINLLTTHTRAMSPEITMQSTHDGRRRLPRIQGLRCHCREAEVVFTSWCGRHSYEAARGAIKRDRSRMVA